ncbi:MAG: exosortase/archaeosortase family protein [Planctomycetaceae bacterium]|nr:exosortase/archaeosortase family protein [Planctomycetaceae bacterium]
MTTDQKETQFHCPDWRIRLGYTLGFCLLTAWMFRELLSASVSRWTHEPQYSHGFVVPLMALGLGWMRRDLIASGRARSGPAGLVLLGSGILCHLIAGYLYAEALDGAGLLLSLAGIVLLVWGRRVFRALWPAVLFLLFMLPLPFRVECLLSEPLQMIGASESAWYIQTLGIPAFADGNTIVMNDVRLGVADACSGLRMLMVFFAISAATMLISQRTRWEKILILLSAVPIALVCNIIRIVCTGVAWHSAGRELADLIFHDLSGWLMMPLAMLLLYLELRLLDWVFVEVRDEVPGVMMSRNSAAASTV